MAIACTGPRKESRLLQNPNVLFIGIDDLNDWIEPLAGNSQSLTPNLDNFASEAVNFTHSYCASPGCNPSRTALLTGLHTYSSGMYSNYQDWRKVPELQEGVTLNQHFRKHGYYTAGAGKIYHYDQVDSSGWDDYFPGIFNPMPADNLPENRPLNMPPFKYMYNMFDWGGLAITDEETGDFKTVNYISEQLQREHDKPFFLAAGIYRPHLPWYVPEEYFERFPLEEISLPRVMDGDTSDLGPVARELIVRGGNYHKHVVEAGEWEKAVQGYLASVAFADAMIGRLLAVLEASNYADNTIVVIWSDHGWQLGEKMHWRKFALWENVIRSVLMIRVPEGIAGIPAGSYKAGVSSNPVSLLDIYPTLADLCNLPMPAGLDGTSLKPELIKPGNEPGRPVITTYDYGSYSVRYSKWHYIRYIDDSEELYNLETDPEEWNNLANINSLSSVKNELLSYIPTGPIDLPASSLLQLMEHHVPPFRSIEYFFSNERKEWMKRFE